MYNNLKSVKQISLVEREERMNFNVENTIGKIENHISHLEIDFYKSAKYVENELEDLSSKEDIIRKLKLLANTNDYLIYSNLSLTNNNTAKYEYKDCFKTSF